MKDGHMTPTGSKFIRISWVAVQTEVWENASMTLSKVESESTKDFCYKRERNLLAQNLMIAVSRLQKVSQHAFEKLGMSRVPIVKQVSCQVSYPQMSQ
nr:hypothetical protein [Tanacetum cinerariifolium]